MRLLVVDDNTDAADLLRQVLELEGYEVVVAHDGDEALRWLREGYAPALVVTDLMMPGVTGWELLRTMEREFPNVPRLVVSALPRKFHATNAPAMTKPVDVKALLDTIQRLVTEGRDAADRAGR